MPISWLTFQRVTVDRGDQSHLGLITSKERHRKEDENYVQR